MILHCVILNILYIIIPTFLPYLIMKSGGNELTYGLLLTFFNLGGIIGGIISMIKKKIHNKEILYYVSSIFLFLNILLFTYVSSIIIRVITFLLSGVCLSFLGTMYTVLIQDRTDFSVQGRVFAFETFLTYLSVPLALVFRYWAF